MTRRLRVLLVVPQLHPVLGMERAAAAVVNGISPEATIHVLALSGPSTGNAVPGAASLQTAHLTGGLPRFLRAWPVIRRHVGSFRPDVVIASGIWAAIPAFPVLRGGVPLVVWEHSLLPQRISRERRLRWMQRVARLTYPKATAVVAVSRSVAGHLEALGVPAAKVTVIPNPVPARPPRLLPPVSARRRGIQMTGLGSLNPGKNFALAIQALPFLPDNAQLTLAGEGPERQALADLAQSENVASRVRFLGQVADVDALLAQTDVLVHPSTAETFGMAVFEAANYDVPVVVLDYPAMNEYVPDLAAGRLLPAHTGPARFAAGVLDALRLPASDYQRARRRRTSLTDGDVVAQQWLGLMRHLTLDPGTPRGASPTRDQAVAVPGAAGRT